VVRSRNRVRARGGGEKERMERILRYRSAILRGRGGRGERPRPRGLHQERKEGGEHGWGSFASVTGTRGEKKGGERGKSWVLS